MEMAVIIAVMALLVGLSVPAVRAFVKSFEAGSNTKSIISAALSTARAIAAKNQRYAGIRFQKAYQPEGPLNAPQYMVFIIYDTEIPHLVAGNLGCRAVEGMKPIKLPDSTGVMDLRYNSDLFASPGDGIVDDDDEISNINVVTDTTTFSILFSPSGKLIIHSLWVRNRDGADDVFNTLANVSNNTGMFVQDEDSEEFPIEDSRNSFIIYEQKEFMRAYERGQAWSEYLINLEPFYINAYMGTIIE